MIFGLNNIYKYYIRLLTEKISIDIMEIFLF